LPAADSAIVLVAFDAESEIIHNDFKISKSKVADLYLGQGESKVDTSKSILTRFIIKLPSEKYGSAFYKITNRKALAMPVLNCVAVVGVEDDYFTDCRIVVAPVAPIPFRMRAVEDKLIGKKISADIIEDAAENSMNMSKPRNSRIRGSMEYRKEMVKILVRRTLIKAIERARNR
jgi:CO/xanthine dehydrogenase FAD-binding subunit